MSYTQKLSRRDFALAALAATLPRLNAKPDKRRPNILLILADDLGWTAPSCFGNKDVSTPNIDGLAKAGVRFTTAYAEPQCSPTRGSLLSGQYGARTGLFKVITEKEPPNTFLRIPEPNLAMKPSVATLTTSLRAAGYATGMSGKWHIADAYQAAGLRERDGGRYFDRYGFDFCGPASEHEHREDKAVEAIISDIIGFIERNQSRPWFAYMAHFTTHTKLSAPKALVDKYAARGYRRTSLPQALFAERPTAEYLAMLEHLDNQVGRILKRLDDLGMARDTLVIFNSDNGGLSRMTSNAPLREGKGSPYEGGVRVPLIFRWPGHVKPGTVCETPVHTIDFYPTFLELAHGKAPQGHTLDGESLVPLLERRGRLRRDALFWYSPSYTLMYGKTPCSWIRQGDWKLLHWYGDYLDPAGFTPDQVPYGKLVVGARTELYNIKNDVGEQHNLAASNPGKVAALMSRLEAWWRETGAKQPTRNPDFDPKPWQNPPQWIGARYLNSKYPRGVTSPFPRRPMAHHQ